MKPKYYVRVWDTLSDYEVRVNDTEYKFSTLKKARTFLKKGSPIFYKAELGHLGDLREPFDFIDGTSIEMLTTRFNEILTTPKGMKAAVQFLATC